MSGAPRCIAIRDILPILADYWVILLNKKTHVDPLVLDDVVDGEPLGGVGLQHAADQVLGVLRYVLPFCQIVMNIMQKKHFFFLFSKRWSNLAWGTRTVQI